MFGDLLVIGKRDRDGAGRRRDAGVTLPASPNGLIPRMAGSIAKGTICSACRRHQAGRIIV
jgi:hypothetical protein